MKGPSTGSRSLTKPQPRRPIPCSVGRAAAASSTSPRLTGTRARPGSGTATKWLPQSSKPRGHMSRTIKFAKAGGTEVLEFLDTEVPAPGPTEVRIKGKAIGINRAESMWRADMYIDPVKFPAGLGDEAATLVTTASRDASCA